MKKVMLSLFVLALVASGALAQAPVVNAGWEVFVIREGATLAPFIVDNDDYVVDSIEIGTTQGGQKVGLATDLINGAKVSQIATLHIDRLDDVVASGSLYGPYFNIWVTDGLGNYAVIGNEPSNAEWATDRWDVSSWDDLKTKTCKVYETPGASTGTSWLHVLIGNAGPLVFEDIGDLVIEPPSVAYITNPANAVGSGAPDEILTNIAYGYTWVFGDTANNYVTGGDGFIVNGYSATATFSVQNTTQITSYATIEAALADAVAYDVITVDDGTYNPPNTLYFNVPLTMTGQSEAGVIINIATAGGYGMAIASHDVSLGSFTLVANATNENFPIHASGTSNPPNGFNNLTLQNITIQGVHRRTGFDVHGYNTVVLSNLTSSDATGGNGVQITGCVGVTVDNITTLNNAWGSFAIYSSNSSSLNRGSDNVNINGSSCSFGEGNLFNQDEFGLFNTNITVAGYGYLVQNFNFRPDAAGYTFYQDTEANAIATALGLDSIAPGSWITLISGGTHIVAPGMGIQFAIDGSSPGDVINVAAAHFEEQLHITTDNLTITGAGAGATFVDAPNNMPLFFTTGTNNNFPVIFVDGAVGTAISALTIDGQGYGATNYRFVGLGLHNANGTYSDLAVTGLRNEPLNGNQHGIGLYAINDDVVARTVNFTDIAVTDIQKNGATFDGAGLNVLATRVNCTGSGPLGLGLPAQNGIQYSGGSTGVLTDCVISDYNYTEPSYTATGLLVFDSGSVQANGCTITSCKTSVYYIDASGSMDGCVVTDPQGDPLYAYSTGGAKAAMKISPNPLDPRARVANMDKAALTFAIYNSTFTGNDVVDSWGPTAYAAGPVDFTVQGSTIEHFDYGLVMYEDGGVVTGSASGNVLANNLTYGGFSNTVVPFDARGNDWGSFSGPYHPTLNPTGTGNEVTDNILFDPWTGMATVAIAPATTGPITCGQTVPLTVSYSSDASTPDLFLYNMILSADAAVSLPTLSSGFTSLMPFGGPANNETFLVYSNGNGTWTVTGSTVANSGQELPPGSNNVGLFTVDLLTVTDGLANVTISSLTLRDPNNVTFYSSVGGATIEVDCTVPAAVAGITAEPRHNKVDVSWTHDLADVDHFEVYRGLWYDAAVGVSAYPEYDDEPANVIPTRPTGFGVFPGPAGEWVQVDDGLVTTVTFTDTWTTPMRGVYYYEVFAVDAAGNGSTVAAANDRATNYWLGDVYGGSAMDPVPNGEVEVWDMNELGAAFGITVPHGDPENILDVGPTDDWSRVGIPLTDSLINFEDLMVFSMNFGVVTPAKADQQISKVIELAWVSYDDGRQALRLVEGSGVKGLNVRANKPVNGVTAGDLLDQQSEMTFLKNVGERLDVSVAVTGTNVGFAGSGDLFIIEAADAIDVTALTIKVRGFDNSKLEFRMDEKSGTLAPRVFALNPNYPNPFNPMTKISFSLPEAQDVRLAVYGVDGRKVATLLNETRGPGLHEVIWNGQDDSGRQAASGMYFYRIDAGPYSQVHKMTLMK